MFNIKTSRKADTETMGTVIGEGIEFSNGIIKGCGNVMVNGLIFGDVDIEGHLYVDEAGYIKGNVSATSSTIAGRLEGDIAVTGLLHLTKCCNIQGNIECAVISIEEDAVFCGRCHMTGKNEQRKLKHEILPEPEIEPGT